MSQGDNPGVIARPPFVYLVSILAGCVLEIFWPLPVVPSWLGVVLGPALVATGAILFALAGRRFLQAGTPLPTKETPTVIVQSGPYQWSRNPIYLGFSLLYLGIALWVNSAWLLLTLAATLVLMTYGVILREERYLAARFGEEYLSYKARVRRWL